MKLVTVCLLALLMTGCNDSKTSPYDTGMGDTDPPDACVPVEDTDGTSHEEVGDANSNDEDCDGLSVLGRHNESGTYSAYDVMLVPGEDRGRGCWSDIFDGWGHIWCVQMVPLGGGLTLAADADIFIEGTEGSGYTSLQVGWTDAQGGYITLGNDYAGEDDAGCIYFLPRAEFEVGGTWTLPDDASGSVCGTQANAFVGSGHGVADLTGDGEADFFTSSLGRLYVFTGPFDFTAHQDLGSATFTLDLCPDADCSGYVGKNYGVGDTVFFHTDYNYAAAGGQEGKMWTMPLPLTPTSTPTAIATAGAGAPSLFGFEDAILSGNRYVVVTNEGAALFDETGFVQTIGAPPPQPDLVHTLGVDAFVTNGVEYVVVGNGSGPSPQLNVYSIQADNTVERVLNPFLPGGEDSYCGSRLDIEVQDGLAYGVYGCQYEGNQPPQGYGGGTFVLSPLLP